MIRFQCPHCQGIVAAEVWEPGAETICAYCSKTTAMPAERVMPGTVLGDFLLVRKLGAGGMGVVYLAHQLSLDRPAAIKVLNPEFSHEAESVKAFIREARSAAKINHPNLVQAFAVGEEDGIFFFAMEFLDGKTMKEILQVEKVIEPRRAAMIVMQVADALDCAWREQKLIHRDIKPDNIMQCSNERYKLADLGLAGTFGDDDRSDSDEVIGTPQYINPEQLTGKMTDTRSDIYSLGATFYHFVTGKFPFYDENIDEIAKKHLTEELVPPMAVNPQVPKVLSDVIVKMMAKDPSRRYQSCADLVEVLKAFLSSSSAPAAAPAVGSEAASTVTGKLTGSGNMSIQPKIQPSGGGVKIAIKTVEKSSGSTPEKADGEKSEKSEEKNPETQNKDQAEKEKSKTEAPKTEEVKDAAPAADAKPAPKIKTPSAQPQKSVAKITLMRPGANKKSPAASASQPAAEKAAEANSTAAPAAELASGAADGAAPEAKIAPAAGLAPAAELAPAEDVVSGAAVEVASLKTKRKKGLSGKKIAFLVVLLVCGGAIAGGVFYHLHGKAARKASEKAAEKISLKNTAPVVAQTETKTVDETPVVEKYKMADKSFCQAVEELRKLRDADQSEFSKKEKSLFVEEYEAWEKWKRENSSLPNTTSDDKNDQQLYKELQISYNFLQKAYQLKHLSIYNRANFLRQWSGIYARLKPANEWEKKIYGELYQIYVKKYAEDLVALSSSNGNNFVHKWCNGEYVKFQKLIRSREDQKLYQELIDTFFVVSEAKMQEQRDEAQRIYNSDKKKKADQKFRAQKAAENAAKKKRFAELEKSHDRIALSSKAEYVKDLPRKMARVDMALWSYGQNPSAQNAAILKREIEWAKQEKDRVKDYPELQSEAEKLIVYAEKLKVIAEQGKYVTDSLSKRAWNKRVVKDSSLSITVINSNKLTLYLRVQYFPKRVPKGVKAKPVPKPKNITLKLDGGDIIDNQAWIANFESTLGHSDMYFYYMLYNGFWEHGNKLEAIAPAVEQQYWRERDIDNMAYNFFKRLLWLTDQDGVARYTKRFGNWKSFKRALKDYQKEFNNL